MCTELRLALLNAYACSYVSMSVFTYLLASNIIATPAITYFCRNLTAYNDYIQLPLIDNDQSQKIDYFCHEAWIRLL